VSSAVRVYHDPLHGAIALDHGDPLEALLIRLIDTPQFQRLRRIRQLGPASFTFHGAETSRFTHSLGVMAIARRAFTHLTHAYPQLLSHRPVVLVAALLHDVGHGPFSHTGEEVFGTHHETWTTRIIREAKPVRSLLDRFDPDLAEAVIQVYAKQYPIAAISQLVSSQLDCDRLDYLMRDSYFTGASYGNLDLDRILMALQFDPVTQQLVVQRKSLSAVEHYLLVRRFMYTQVYNHAKNLSATWILEQAFRRARDLMRLGRDTGESSETGESSDADQCGLIVDPTMQHWLQDEGDGMPLEAYLQADDGVFTYHLQRWQHCSDGVLADLCRRYLDRDLFKTLDITQFSKAEGLDLQAQVLNLAAQLWDHPHHYCGVRVAVSRGYALYQRGIKLQSAKGLVELSDLSPLVRTLTQPDHKALLIYPREIQTQVTQLVGA
jgi:uncharacterized protein